MRYLYHFISWIFFPGLVAIFGFALILEFEMKALALQLLTLPILFYLVVPIIIVFVLKKAGLVSDLFITLREERNISYPIGIGLAVLLFVISKNESWLYTHWIKAGIALLGSLWIINALGMKASAHMAGASGLFVLTLYGYTKSMGWEYMAMAGGICVLVYIARKGLSAHSHIELLAGFCLGFIATFAMFRI